MGLKSRAGIRWASALGIIAGSLLALFAYWSETYGCACPGGFSCPPFCTHPNETSLLVFSVFLVVVSLVGLILSFKAKGGVLVDARDSTESSH